jgi:26S proteasome regulatory subunit N2
MVKERQKRRESMDVDHTPTTPKPSADDDKMDLDEDSKKEEAEKAEGVAAESSKKKTEKERVGYELENMSRVLPPQVKYISFPSERYVPVKKVSRSHDISNRASTNTPQPTLGVILLTDTKPSEPKELLELKVKKAAPAPAPGASGSAMDLGLEDAPVTPGAGPVSDNMVDEGDSEAPTPGEFEYESDTNPNDDE